jgi:hypothetical protein
MIRTKSAHSAPSGAHNRDQPGNQRKNSFFATHLRVFLACRTRGGESPCIDTQGGLKASDCGRLGCQAAGHPWSALRVVKSCRKNCPTASVLPKPKEQLCIQSGIRAYYLNHLQEVGEAEERSAGNRIGYQVIDRQVETRPMSAGTQADRAAS